MPSPADTSARPRAPRPRCRAPPWSYIDYFHFAEKFFAPPVPCVGQPPDGAPMSDPSWPACFSPSSPGPPLRTNGPLLCVGQPPAPALGVCTPNQRRRGDRLRARAKGSATKTVKPPKRAPTSGRQFSALASRQPPDASASSDAPWPACFSPQTSESVPCVGQPPKAMKAAPAKAVKAAPAKAKEARLNSNTITIDQS